MNDLDELIKMISPEYASLAESTRKNLQNFFILWSIFESKQLGCEATMSKLKALAETIELNRIDLTELKDLFSFFLGRYITSSKPNKRFAKLRFRERHRREGECVESFLAAPSDEPREVLKICLYIILRVRNNLFHGTKWTGTITDHDQLFCRINALLRMLLVAGMHNPSALN